MRMLSFKHINQALFAIIASVVLQGCLSEYAPGSYYTFTGQTVADFLYNETEKSSDSVFSDFITILKRANIWSELSTYGTYTCFAPTNNAVRAYLRKISPTYTLDSLTDADCDTLAWTHLVNTVCYSSDINEGALPEMNLNDRFLVLSFDSVPNEENGSYRLRYCINQNTHLIQMDDTCENGVVHVVDSVIVAAGDFIYDVVQANPECTIFAQALKLVGFEDSLKYWYDQSYSVGYDSVKYGIKMNGGGSVYNVYYWEKKKTNYTFLIEPDVVLAKCGINSIEDLIAKSKEIYDESFPNDAGLYDDDFYNRKNPLNRFVSYHILPFYAAINGFNEREDISESRNLGKVDPEDYFATYMPHSIMRVSTTRSGAEKGVYINRRGVASRAPLEGEPSNIRGVKIYEPTSVSQEARNGIIHYVDTLLVYDRFVRETVLNRRMRIDCSTLSPDFLTSGGRQRQNADSYTEMGFKQPTNFHFFTDCIIAVRGAFAANWSYQGDGVDMQGNYDFYVKLPPVPFDGTWEVRLSHSAHENRGVVQIFLGEKSESSQQISWAPCGIPSDFRVAATDPRIGWKEDMTEENSSSISAASIEEYNMALDKSMRNRGFMKAMDSYSNGSDAFRSLSTMARRILSTQYMYAETDYYLRLKLVLDNPKAEMNFDYMELCPKTVYANNEDRH